MRVWWGPYRLADMTEARNTPTLGPGGPQKAAAVVVDPPGRPSPLAVLEPSPVPHEGDPWSRLARESLGAFAQFVAFRDMAYPDGPGARFQARNLGHLAKALGLSPAYVRSLSSSFKWFDRAGAYDRALDYARVETDISEVQRVRGRHLRLLAKARTFAEMELDKMIRRAQDPDIASANPREVRGLLEMVIKNERLLMGEHTDHLKVDGEWNLEDLELEDLEKLEAIRRKAQKDQD
ncbi:MAG: hypothetical protein KAT70_08125 [Thermoplasmata archaeon]|nr:hypothetical protein [Thermoplasmata archaeon]